MIIIEREHQQRRSGFKGFHLTFASAAAPHYDDLLDEIAIEFKFAKCKYKCQYYHHYSFDGDGDIS